MIEQPNDLDPRETKLERLDQVVENLVDQLPASVKLLATNYINLSQQLDEEQIDIFLNKTREMIDYIETGEIATHEHE